MRKRVLAASLAALIWALTPLPALAAEALSLIPQPRENYLDVGLGVFLFSGPGLEAGIISTGLPPAPTTFEYDGADEDLTGIGINITGGHAFGPGSGLFGGTLRAEVAASFGTADETSSQVGPGTGLFVSYFGAFPGHFGFDGTLPVTESAENDVLLVFVDGRLRNDFPLGSSWVASPFVGFRYGHLDQDSSLAYSNALGTQVTYNGEVQTDYYGGVVGFELSGNLGSGWSAHLSSALAGLYADADMDLDGLAPLVAIGFTDTDADDQFAFMGELSAGIAYRFGSVSVGATGTFDYIDSVAGFDIPNTFPTSDQAKIDFDDAWSATGMLRVSVRF